MHFLHIARAKRAIFSNKLKCQRKSAFSVEKSTENSARMGIDDKNQWFYNMVVNRFTGQATEISLRCTPLP